MAERAQRLLVTGLYDLRSCVLALPRLTALRAVSPHHHITVIAPHAARDLLLRLRVADQVQVIAQSALATIIWTLWQKILRRFDAVVDAAQLREGITPDWKKAARDLSSILPAPPFVVLSLIDGWPAVRMAALARKLDVQGYKVVLLGVSRTPAHDRLLKAAPVLIDLTGSVDLADVPVIAHGAHATIGGRDGVATLAALSGARTVILSQGTDVAIDTLPHATTTWIQSDDIGDVSVGDVMKAVA